MSSALSALGHSCSVLGINTGYSENKTRPEPHYEVRLLSCLNKRFLVPFPSLRNYRVIAEEVDKAEIIQLVSHWTLLNAIVYIFCAIKNKKYVITPAGALIIYGRSKYLKYFYNFVIGNRIVKRANQCIAISPNEYPHYKKYGIDRGKISHIPNAAPEINEKDYSANTFRRTFELPDNDIMLYMGRLNRIKGIDLLVRAFIDNSSEFENFILVIAGPDEGLQAELLDQINERNLGAKVFFLGFLGEQDKYHAYKAAEFLVIPSRHEAMSIVALEAGAFSVPVVITDACELNELAECDGGIVVSADTESLADGLIRMVNREDRGEMGERINRHVRNNYTWEIIGEKMESLLTRLVAEC